MGEAMSEMSERANITDDEAILDFSDAMARKMAFCAAKGRSGWQECSIDELWAMLREHVEKGDPVDVGNFAMMIWNNQQATRISQP